MPCFLHSTAYVFLITKKNRTFVVPLFGDNVKY